MDRDSRQEFRRFMRKMSKKGFYEVLNHVNEKKIVHYNEVLRHALSTKIVDSGVSVTIILAGLTDLGLLERTVINSRPIRTRYQVSMRGHKILENLKDLEITYYNHELL